MAAANAALASLTIVSKSVMQANLKLFNKTKGPEPFQALALYLPARAATN
jgi:hypothetical protein